MKKMACSVDDEITLRGHWRPRPVDRAGEHSGTGVVGVSEALDSVLTHAAQSVACTYTTVLVCGEMGTGKELVAPVIHASQGDDVAVVSRKHTSWA